MRPVNRIAGYLRDLGTKMASRNGTTTVKDHPDGEPATPVKRRPRVNGRIRSVTARNIATMLRETLKIPDDAEPDGELLSRFLAEEGRYTLSPFQAGRHLKPGVVQMDGDCLAAYAKAFGYDVPESIYEPTHLARWRARKQLLAGAAERADAAAHKLAAAALANARHSKEQAIANIEFLWPTPGRMLAHHVLAEIRAIVEAERAGVSE